MLDFFSEISRFECEFNKKKFMIHRLLKVLEILTIFLKKFFMFLSFWARKIYCNAVWCKKGEHDSCCMSHKQNKILQNNNQSTGERTWLQLQQTMIRLPIYDGKCGCFRETSRFGVEHLYDLMYDLIKSKRKFTSIVFRVPLKISRESFAFFLSVKEKTFVTQISSFCRT